MERHGKLVLLLLIAAALTVGAWLSLGGGSGGSPIEPVETADATPAELATAPTAAADTDAVEPVALARRTVETEPPRVERDPEIVAALARFVGRVLSHDGAPAAARVVRFYRADPQVALLPGRSPMSDPITDFPEVIAGEATTADDGRFEVAGVWPRAIYLIKADAGGPNPTIRLADRTPGPAETVDLGDIVLKNGAVVVGRVVDDGGDPVAGAMVRAADVPPMVTQMVPIEQFDPEGWVIGGNGDERMVVEMPEWVKRYWKELPVPTTLSAADGSFRLEGIDPGVNLVAATKSGYLAATQKNVKLDPGQERDVGRLVLSEGEVANGKVVDTGGKPIAGVEVIVGSRLIAPIAFGRRAGATDAQGRFECAGLKAGDVVVAARRAVAEPWTITEPQSINKSIVVTLPAQHTLTVRLISEAGREITSPELRLLQVGDAGEGAMVMSIFGFVQPIPLAARQRQLEDGRIQLLGLAASRYSVMAKAAGHAAAAETVDLAGDREVELRLPPAHVVDVKVVDSDDRPIRNAAIYVELRGRGPDRMPFHAGFTAADGSLRVADASRDSATIEASHPRYGVATARVDLPPPGQVVIRLATPGTIEGEVTEDGRPPELGKYMVVANRMRDARGPIAGMPAMSVLDADGKFALRGLQPAQWRVQVIKSMQAIGSFGSLMEMAMVMRFANELPEQDVELAAGETERLRLETKAPRVVDGPSANVSGTVFVDGRPGDGMVIVGWGQSRLSTTVDAGGQFDLGAVKVGHINLQLIDASDRTGPRFNHDLWSKSLQIKAGEDVRLTIEVTTGGLTGVVYDVGGRPAAGARVQAIGTTPGEGGRSGALTDAEGRFEITRLPAGPYAVTAEGMESGRGSVSAVVPTGGRATVRIGLERTFAIAGILDRTPLELPADQRWTWLSFDYQPGDGEKLPPGVRTNRGSGVDESDGSFKVTGLPPGRYRVRIHSGAQGTWTHESTVEIIDRDLDGVRITPVRQQQPPPKKKDG